MWLADGLEPSFAWFEFLKVAGIQNQEKFTMLATVGVLVVVILIIMRVLRPSDDD